MTKRLFATLAVTAAALGGTVLAAPGAGAQEPVLTISYTTPVAGPTAAAACKASDTVVVAQFEVDGVVVDAFPLSEPGQLTVGACVSTITRQELTTAAYVSNCKGLEPLFAAENASGRPYPYAFYGNPDYTARNRADCVYFLRGFHTGTIAPGA